jgi:hypothetical protein
MAHKIFKKKDGCLCCGRYHKPGRVPAGCQKVIELKKLGFTGKRGR